MPSAIVGPAARRLRERERLAEHLLLRARRAIASPIRSDGLGVHRIAEQQDLRRAPEPDHARQEVRRAHVGARQPDLREEERELRRVGHDAEVGGERDDGTRARRDAVDRRDHRPVEPTDVLDHLARQPRELEDVARVALEERADDGVDVAARAEAPCPGP